MTPLEQKQVEVDACLAEMDANREALQKVRDEFNDLRMKYRQGDSKAERRLVELDAEWSRLSNAGHDMHEGRYKRLVQQLAELRTAEGINRLMAPRWLYGGSVGDKKIV